MKASERIKKVNTATVVADVVVACVILSNYFAHDLNGFACFFMWIIFCVGADVMRDTINGEIRWRERHFPDADDF